MTRFWSLSRLESPNSVWWHKFEKDKGPELVIADARNFTLRTRVAHFLVYSSLLKVSVVEYFNQYQFLHVTITVLLDLGIMLFLQVSIKVSYYCSVCMRGKKLHDMRICVFLEELDTLTTSTVGEIRTQISENLVLMSNGRRTRLKFVDATRRLVRLETIQKKMFINILKW